MKKNSDYLRTATKGEEYFEFIMPLYRSCIDTYKHKDYNLTCSNGVLIIEQVCKAIGTKNGNLSETERKRHKLKKLLNKLNKIDIQRLGLEDSKKVNEFTDMYYQGRYPLRSGEYNEYEQGDAIEIGKVAYKAIQIFAKEFHIDEKQLPTNFFKLKDDFNFIEKEFKSSIIYPFSDQISS